MRKPEIALPVSQHFNKVFPKLPDIAKLLVVRDIKALPDIFALSQRKVYHTDGFIDTAFTDKITKEFIGILNMHNVEHMSFDCGPSCRNVYCNPKDNDCYCPVNPAEILAPKELLMIAEERIKFIRGHFKGTIALENLDYHSGGAYEHVCNPDFISAIIRKLDVYMALDLGHLLVTAFNFNMEPSEYITRLPLERVYEIHLSHPEKGNDMHECPTAYEYELLAYLLSKCSPDFIVLEYYKDPLKIVEENIRLANFLNIPYCHAAKD